MGDFAYRPTASRRDRGAVLNEMQDLAVRTGGRYTGLRGWTVWPQTLPALRQGRTDYYLLGFIPTGASADKPCHKLKVTVDRKGLEVNARESYCTSGAPETREAKPQKTLEARMGWRGWKCEGRNAIVVVLFERGVYRWWKSRWTSILQR